MLTRWIGEREIMGEGALDEPSLYLRSLKRTVKYEADRRCFPPITIFGMYSYQFWEAFHQELLETPFQRDSFEGDDASCVRRSEELMPQLWDCDDVVVRRIFVIKVESVGEDLLSVLSCPWDWEA